MPVFQAASAPKRTGGGAPPAVPSAPPPPRRGLLDRRRMTPLPTVLCLPLALAGAVVARLALDLRWVFYPGLIDRLLVEPLAAVKSVVEVPYYFELRLMFPPNAMPGSFVALGVVGLAAAAIMVLAALLGLCFRRRWVLYAIRKGYAAAYALMVFYGWFVFSTTAAIEEQRIEKLPGVGDVNAVSLFYLRWDYLWLPAAVTFVMAVLHLSAWRRAVINVYTGRDDREPAPGDVIVENLRTHGKDPEYRRSSLASVLAHLMVIIVIPFLLDLIGCVDPYKPPWGGGKPAVMMRMVKKPPKKKKRKKYILATDAAIYFKVPDLDDSKIMEEVEEETQVRYAADASAAHGKLGDGPANQAGWQDGFKDGMVRFIRLEYQGQAWDDGMDASSRADMNFLERFKELSGGMKIADHPESHPIHYLKKYPKGLAPPFVYMTGHGGIDGASRSDIKILRDYLLGGGMLIADCGSTSWDRAFRNFVTQVFPDNPMREIADDDPIFQIPFQFPNGAPPLWHHGGMRAQGVKYKGRWCVFYHPGDMNDAWKTGHSGLDPELAQGAFHMGVNLLYHAHMNYIQETRKYRK